MQLVKILKCGLTVFAAAAFVQLPAATWAATVTVNINKVKVAKGDIRASLCDTEATYKGDKCAMESIVKAQSGTTQLRFENVKPGTYAFHLMHDKNSNGEMDFNAFGIPKEGYGFSNNVKPGLSMPAFKKVAFVVAEQDVTQNVDLIN